MKEEYISIAEFAKRAGVSKQAIYKRLSTDLSTELKEVENQKMLKVSALSRFGVNQVEQPFNQVDQPVDSLSKGIIDLLREELEAKNKQLEAKDKQIEQMQRLIDQQQQLHAASLKALPSGSMQQREEQSAEAAAQKRGFLAKLFAKKEGG